MIEAKICPREVCSKEACLSEVCHDEVCPKKVCPAQISLSENCISKIDPSKVGVSKVWSYFWMLASPLIPRLYPLRQPCEMFLVRHRSVLLHLPQLEQSTGLYLDAGIKANLSQLSYGQLWCPRRCSGKSSSSMIVKGTVS